MATWARRFHRRAATLGSVVTSCGHANAQPYPRRMEKVKFGIPLEQVCKHEIPAPLLVLILKLNKEAPLKKDIFRAPGHQGNMKKLIHFLQSGRLVNVDNFSAYTIASVLKKFLRKLPGGVFGPECEEILFDIIDMEDTEQQRDAAHRLITSLPPYTQQLLVLLFGTFRVIATNAERAETGMTSEALGVSVAPSFFQSCVSNGKQAKMEDVVRFKTATRVMKFLIDNFGVTNLFGRENYEYYARITGRVLRIEEEWIFSFRYPPDTMLPPISSQEESHSTPALLHMRDSMFDDDDDLDAPGTSSSMMLIPEAALRESCTRLSVSLEANGLFKVHERQTARMRTRSEWFLSSGAPESCALTSGVVIVPIDLEETSWSTLLADVNGDKQQQQQPSAAVTACGGGNGGSSLEGIKMLLRRTSSKEKRHVSRGSSRRKRNKENGNKAYSVEALHSGDGSDANGGGGVNVPPLRTQSVRSITEQDCTELDVQTFHITLTYKPRI